MQKSVRRASTHVKRQFFKRASEPVWKYGLNGPALKQYRQDPPALGSEARRMVADLDADGCAVGTLESLTGDAGLLGRLQELAGDLERRNEQLIAQHRERLEAGVRASVWDKPFVVTLLDKSRPVIEPDGVLAGVGLHPQLRGIADAYFGVRTRVSDINIWRSLTSSQQPQSSQLWHRDLPDDFYVLKMFLYLEDVDEGTGPFTYLLGTHRKGDRRDLVLPSHHDGQNLRSSDDAPEQAGVGDRVRSLTGPAGTVVFADTLGYHRGGWARTRPRLLLQVLYSSRTAVPVRLLAAPYDVRGSDYQHDLAYAAGDR